MESMYDAREIWDNCLEIIKKDIKEQAFVTWFKPIKPLRLENNKLTIQVPSQFFYEWIESNFNTLINKSIKNVLGMEARLTYQIVQPEEAIEPEINLIHNEIEKTDKEISQKNNLPEYPELESNLNTKYTFDNFIRGDHNQLARAAALAVAANPGGTPYNPLIIYGGVGLGKTHLIQAIGNEAISKSKTKRVKYISSEKFTVDFVDSISNNKTNEFSIYYRSMDVLIVDDIQFFEGKERTQDMFFHTFNTLHQQNKQIILSCDRPPKDLKGIPERLISRFTWGLTVDIQPPDYETRIAILKKKSDSMGLEIQSEIIEFIAMNITANVREMEGALIGLLAESSISNKDITIDLAREVVKKSASSNSKKNITIDQIQRIICDHYNISEDLLRDKTRKQEIALARQVAMYFSKDLTKYSLKAIGLHFGGRDHTTVIHAINCINDLRTSSEKFKKELDNIRKKVEMMT
jgi:chromosomal replication initiator protein